MAAQQAITVFESIYQRTDQQIRDILATAEGVAEVDTINVLIGDGVSELVPGVAAALRVDFRARLTGCFLQEFDGISGSVGISVERAAGGAAPVWTQISPTSPPGISGGRYFADEDLDAWTDTALARGDYLRFSVASASTIMRVHVGLRMRRLEP